MLDHPAERCANPDLSQPGPRSGLAHRAVQPQGTSTLVVAWFAGRVCPTATRPARPLPSSAPQYPGQGAARKSHCNEGTDNPAVNWLAMDRFFLLLICASIVLLTTAIGLASPSVHHDHAMDDALPLLLRIVPS